MPHCIYRLVRIYYYFQIIVLTLVKIVRARSQRGKYNAVQNNDINYWIYYVSKFFTKHIVCT